MADGLSITEPKIEVNSLENSSIEGLDKANLYNMDVNYANQNKWFGSWQLEDILGKKYKNLNLHLTRFSIPQLMTSSSSVSYRGYQKEIPTKVLMPDTKEITIEYIVDSNWENYRALYAMMSNINGTINPISTDEKTGILPSEYLPFRIYLLGPYKRKIISFLFENTWIKIFNEISLDVNQPGEVTHSVTIAWDQYRIEDL